MPADGEQGAAAKPRRRALDWTLGFSRQDVRLCLNFLMIMLRDRFLGSQLGSVWALLQPALLICVFVFVFTVLLPTRLPGHEPGLAFVIWLISGYGPWLAINEGIGGATSSVVGQTGLVKNLAFKSELLPIAAVGLGILPLLVSLAALLILFVFTGTAPSIAWLSLPFVLVLQTIFVIGIGLYLAALNVFVRDIALVLPSALTMILFLSPIFYPIEAFPDGIQTVVALNPFYIIAHAYRAPIMDHTFAPLWHYGYLAGLGAFMLVSGLMFFRRLKTYFHGRL